MFRQLISKAAIGIVIFQATGCAIKQAPPPEPVTHAPIEIDEAMQLRRDWPVLVVHYANGQTVGWPTGFLLEPLTKPKWSAAVTDTPIFVVNCLALPIVTIFAPPWQPVIYPRGEIEASYTANPPLAEK
jgi:hypothetical protein